MADVSRETYVKNEIETIIDNGWILWLNKNHIEQGLKFVLNYIKNHSDHRKHTYELVDKPKQQCNGIFIDEK